MAELYRRTGSPCFYFDATLPDGTRVRESTRATNRREAQRVADARIAVLREEAALPGTPITLSDALTRYVDHLTKRGKASAAGTRALADKIVGRRGAAFSLDGQRPLHLIEQADVARLHAARLDEGLSIQTANHEVKTLRAAINYAALMGRKAPALRFRLPTPPQKTRWLEWAEFEAAFAALDPSRFGGLRARQRQEAQDILVALVMSGGRWSEVAALRWDMVDTVDWLHIRLWGFKDRQERLVPIPAQFEDVLRRRWSERRNSALIFPGADGETQRAGPSRAIARAMDRAGLNEPHIVRRHGRATVHSLRHTFASWLLQRGLTLSEVQALLGHASPTMTARYAHLAVGQTINRATQALMEMT